MIKIKLGLYLVNFQEIVRDSPTHFLMSSNSNDRTQAASILQNSVEDIHHGQTITQFTRKAAACVVAVALLTIGIVFMLATQSGESKQGTSMSQHWPRVAAVKSWMQRFLRQAMRNTGPKRYAY